MNHVEIIKSSVNSIELISKFIKLNKHNKGCCPFHDEKTPSFKVYDNDRGFYCFGCGKSGNIINFIMLINNLDFKDTLIWFDDNYNLGLFKKKSYKEFQKIKTYQEENFKKINEEKIKQYKINQFINYTKFIKQYKGNNNPHSIYLEKLLDSILLDKADIDIIISNKKMLLEWCKIGEIYSQSENLKFIWRNKNGT